MVMFNWRCTSLTLSMKVIYQFRRLPQTWDLITIYSIINIARESIAWQNSPQSFATPCMHLPRAENVGCFLSGKLEFSLVLVALETPSTTYKMADRHQRFQETTSYNLGQNKMEQQTPVPPKSRMKPREGQKRAIFPSLIWEGGRGGV